MRWDRENPFDTPCAPAAPPTPPAAPAGTCASAPAPPRLCRRVPPPDGRAPGPGERGLAQTVAGCTWPCTAAPCGNRFDIHSLRCLFAQCSLVCDSTMRTPEALCIARRLGFRSASPAGCLSGVGALPRPAAALHRRQPARRQPAAAGPPAAAHPAAALHLARGESPRPAVAHLATGHRQARHCIARRWRSRRLRFTSPVGGSPSGWPETARPAAAAGLLARLSDPQRFASPGHGAAWWQTGPGPGPHDGSSDHHCSIRPWI